MGQKVHPKGFRLGVYLDWDARWFARGSYADQVMQDVKIRKFLDSALDSAEVSKIEIEKAGDAVKVIVHTARPGVVIGKKGQEINQLRHQLSEICGVQNVDISVQEVKRPELNATLIAKSIASQIERRASYKRAMKRAALSALKSGAKGIKICCSGRLSGAEIARSEWVREGSIPLHTLRADVDYGFAEAMTTYGIIGIKVWLCRGDYPVHKNA